MAIILENITFDCQDAATLARFWSEVLGRQVDDGANESFATVGKDADGPTLMFIQVPEARTVKNRVHLDLASRELAEEVERLVGLGAKQVADHVEYGMHWITLTDPEGNVFDIAELH